MKRSIIITAIFGAGIFFAFSESVTAQKKAITKNDYQRAFEQAKEAMAYPYRKTERFAPYTDFESPESLHEEKGIKVSSKVVITEYTSEDRLRITTETTSEKGKSILRQMQIEGDCYTFAESTWMKNTLSCGGGATGAHAPQTEEYFVEQAMVDAAKVTVYRYVPTSWGSKRAESTFTVDGKGRLVKREDPFKTTTYEYGVRFEPVVPPGKKRSHR